MSTHSPIERQEQKYQVQVGDRSQQQSLSKSPFQFEDNRSESAAQRNTQDIINESQTQRNTKQLQNRIHCQSGPLLVQRKIQPFGADLRPPVSLAKSGPPPVSSSNPIQRVVSEEQFIEDTTSSFLCCFKWRKGDETQLQDMQSKLKDFDLAETNVEKYKTLQILTNTAPTYNKRGISEKFKDALLKIIMEGRDLSYKLEETEEVFLYKETLKQEKEEALERERQEEDERLDRLSIAERVIEFGEGGMLATIQILVEGINETDNDSVRVNKLFRNFPNLGFEYTMLGKGCSGLLAGAYNGDCATLATAFQFVAKNVLAVSAAVDTASNNGFNDFMAPKTAVIDGTTGNVDNGSFWVFSSHTWALAAGEKFDLLFMSKIVNMGAWTQSELGDESAGFKFGLLEVEKDPGESSVSTKWRTKK